MFPKTKFQVESIHRWMPFGRIEEYLPNVSQGSLIPLQMSCLSREKFAETNRYLD